jgi:hypothetical protein
VLLLLHALCRYSFLPDSTGVKTTIGLILMIPNQPTCAATTGTVMYPLPQGEDYNSFYSWILGILGTLDVGVSVHPVIPLSGLI